MKLEQIKDEPGRLGVWRDLKTGLEFETFTRDVPVGYMGFRYGLEGRSICSIEAKKIEQQRRPDGSVVEVVSMRFSILKGSFETHSKWPNLKDKVKRHLDDITFDELLPLIIEGWEQFYHRHLSQKLYLKIIIDENA